MARVSPFEPAYKYFVELCRRCEGNRYVPRIETATQLEGGGHLAVLEYLHAPDAELVEQFLRHWAHPAEADPDLRLLRYEVDSVDRWCRENVRWWGPRVDIGDRHVLLSSDGNPKLIDLFFVERERLIDDLISDPHAFARYMPFDQCRYIFDVADLQDDATPTEYLDRIRDALAVVASAS
ncbi:MAG TPA: hypothetical protein VHX39_22085 [Acetobacteraceae bacterium]|nr:hypothetical protein [Acetobacteraceae bacterium]